MTPAPSSPKGKKVPPKDEPDAAGPDYVELAKAIGKELAAVGEQFKATFEQVAEDAQYHLDKEFAKALAKHPGLYAEIRKTMRQIKRTVDKASEALGNTDKK